MIAQSARDKLTFKLGPLDRIGKRRVTAIFDGEQIHNDEFSPFENWRRANFAADVDAKLRDHLANGSDGANETYVEVFGPDTGDDPDLLWIGERVVAAANAAEEAEDGSKRPSPIGIATLSAEHPRLAPCIIDGVLRRGETMNVIAPPKIGKSWLGYQFLLSIAVGRWLFDSHRCHCGRVLLIDNELHPAVIASRIKTSAEAMGIQQREYADNLDILSLRGRLLDLNGIATALEGIEPGTYDFVLLDAFYRCFAPGVSENDNSAVAGMYNLIDGIAGRLDCAWGNIHHSSKGGQADKSVVDVGAGAGSQSRAADCHTILREHEEKNTVVLEAVVRSFAPIEPMALRWNFPLWTRDDGIDVKAIKGRLTRGEQRTNDRDEEGINAIVKALETASEPLSRKHIQDLVLGCGKARSDRLLGRLESSGRLKRQSGKRHGIPCDEFWLVSRAEELVQAAGTETGTPVCDTVPVQPASQPVRALKGARRTGWQKPVRKGNAKRKKKLRVVKADDDHETNEG